MQFLVRIKYDDKQGTIGTLRTDHHCAAGEVVYAQQGRATVTHCHHVTPVPTKTIITYHGIVTCRDDDSHDDEPPAKWGNDEPYFCR